MLKLPPEKLGSFYLGAKYNIASKETTAEQINYDARDLTTHAVCVGMTGSGKTGLCIGLLEEAAIDSVPAIIIDPKGDMCNLLLQFENLDQDDFKKWINADDAGRKGMSIDEYAKATANKWKNGLAKWGQGTERIKSLKQSVDYTVYTPGSDAGVPINIMGSFAAPKVDFEADAEMIRERIQGTVAALLGMIESKEDPVRSREGILLANLFEHYWKKKEDLDLASLIRGIQKPPFSQLGVFDVDTFFPEKDRFDLAMEFNSLMASPQFSYWLKGEDLDIEKLYFTADGKPRHSIFYIAHLSDSERMFFVTLLLNSLISWMRRQSGTTSLRSLLYFDEIFGYFPPTAQPPSKKPLLTILKQARAYGVGAVLVTQNPVDIDYKGLSNAGTWFIGKMQTEQDKSRVLDGLQGAIAEAGSSSENDFGKIISSLSSRVFLYHNVHQSAPTVFHTRWAMSYLRGPLTRPQVKELMKAKKSNVVSPYSNNNKRQYMDTKSAVHDSTTSVSIEQAPSIDHEVQQKFIAVWKSPGETGLRGKLTLVYKPMILASGKVRFNDSKRNIDEVENASYLAASPDEFGRVDWEKAEAIKNWESFLISEPDHPDNVNVRYADIPSTMNRAKNFSKIKKEYNDWLYSNKHYLSLEHIKLKLYKSSEESEEAFRMRVQHVAKEFRDEDLDEIQEKYKIKFKRVEDKIRKEEQDLEEAESDLRSRRNSEFIGMAETVFSMFVKKRSRSFSSTVSKSRMRRKAKEKVESAEEDLENLDLDYRDLEDELKNKLEEVRKKWESISEGISRKEIKPRRTDVKVDTALLVWHPVWHAENGEKVSARRD